MQKHSTMLVRHLPAEGVRVDVYYRRDGSQPDDVAVHEQLFDGDPAIAVHSVGCNQLPRFPGHYYANCWRESRSLWRAMQASGKRYEFVYTQGYTGWYGVTKGREPNRNTPPVGVHAHGIEALQEDWRTWRLIREGFAPFWQRRIIQAADVNLSLGGGLDDLIVLAGAHRSTILPAYNGIGEVWLRPLGAPNKHSDQTRFIFVGRDSIRKGYTELKRATESLLHTQGFTIDFVGPVSNANRINSPNVRYHGLVREEGRLRRLYAQADVLVCPSYSEGMPTVILEAMASGLTVIATDVGAVRMVVDQESGWLIERHNTQALIKAMHAAMTASLVPKKLAARKRVEQHTWPAVTVRFTSSLRRYLAGVATPECQTHGSKS